MCGAAFRASLIVLRRFERGTCIYAGGLRRERSFEKQGALLRSRGWSWFWLDFKQRAGAQDAYIHAIVGQAMLSSVVVLVFI